MSYFNSKESFNEKTSRKLSSKYICKPEIPKKDFRLNDRNTTKVIKDDESSKDISSEIAQFWRNKKLRSTNKSVISKINLISSENNSENEGQSKPECITQECLCYISQVDSCLTFLLELKDELDKQFINDNTIKRNLANVFRDIKPLKSAYQIILEQIDKLKSRVSGFYLYEVLLDPVVSSLLKVYKSFLNQYAVNAKWIGEFYRDNQDCIDECNNLLVKRQTMNNVSLQHCLYTVFNSLFSLEMMFNRYRKCYDETSKQFQMAGEAKNLISSLLSEMNTNQDQETFLLTQKELNLLTGRIRESKINTRFLCKSVVIKYARRDDKPLTRQLLLFSDCLYVTLLPGNIIGTSKVRHELSMESMKVSEIGGDMITDSSDLKWGLSIDAKEAVQDFYFDSEHTMTRWRDTLLNLIKKEASAMNTINTMNGDTICYQTSLGYDAPRWQKDNAASYCNGIHCFQKFSTAIRRHHCRADGLLYCDTCCNYKVKLEFERAAESKVCELCYNILVKYLNEPELLNDAKNELNTVMERKSRSGVKMGWLFVRSYNKDKSIFLPDVKYFCELTRDLAFLKFYERHEDKIHCEQVKLTGIEIVDLRADSSQYKTLSAKQFIIEDKYKAPLYYLTSESKEDCQGWVESLNNRIISSAQYNH